MIICLVRTLGRTEGGILDHKDSKDIKDELMLVCFAMTIRSVQIKPLKLLLGFIQLNIAFETRFLLC